MQEWISGEGVKNYSNINPSSSYNFGSYKKSCIGVSRLWCTLLVCIPLKVLLAPDDQCYEETYVDGQKELSVLFSLCAHYIEMPQHNIQSVTNFLGNRITHNTNSGTEGVTELDSECESKITTKITFWTVAKSSTTSVHSEIVKGRRSVSC